MPDDSLVPMLFSNESRDGCSDPERLCDAVGTPFSSCSMALYGVSRVWGGLVANRSRPTRATACYRIGAIAQSLPWTHICVVDRDGKIVYGAKAVTSPAAIAAALAKAPAAQRIV